MYYLLGHKLMELPISVDRKEMVAENTYLLALDGDIDFLPNAVQLLVDLMKKNRNLGAACGRIHPVGSGNNEILYQFLQLDKENGENFNYVKVISEKKLAIQMNQLNLLC